MEKKNDKLGFFSLFTMAVGMVIGAGIFTMLTEMVGHAGRSMPFAVLIGSVIAIVSAIPIMFLSSVVDLEGGTYSQGLALLPTGLAGVHGIIKQLGSLGFGVYTISMASYTLQLIPGYSHLERLVAVIYLIMFFLFGLKGTKGASKIQDAMTICLFLALGVFIFGGIPAIKPGYFAKEGFFPEGSSGFMLAAVMLSNSSMGASGIVSLTKECKNPKKNIPLAIIFGTLSVAAIYFLMAMVTSGILPHEQVQGKNLGVVAEAFLSKPMYLFFVIGGALFAMGTSLNALLVFQPAPWTKMAEDGWLPKAFMARDKKFNYPYVLYGIFFVVGGILPVVFDLNITTLTAFTTFPTRIMECMVAFATLRILTLYPNRWKKSAFHVPTPVFVILVLASAALNLYTAWTNATVLTTGSVIGACIAMVIIGGYIYYRYKKGYVNVDHIMVNLKDIPAEEIAEK